MSAVAAAVRCPSRGVSEPLPSVSSSSSSSRCYRSRARVVAAAISRQRCALAMSYAPAPWGEAGPQGPPVVKAVVLHLRLLQRRTTRTPRAVKSLSLAFVRQLRVRPRNQRPTQTLLEARRATKFAARRTAARATADGGNRADRLSPYGERHRPPKQSRTSRPEQLKRRLEPSCGMRLVAQTRSAVGARGRYRAEKGPRCMVDMASIRGSENKTNRRPPDCAAVWGL